MRGERRTRQPPSSVRSLEPRVTTMTTDDIDRKNSGQLVPQLLWWGVGPPRLILCQKSSFCGWWRVVREQIALHPPTP